MADDAPKDETPPALATAPDEGEPKVSVSFDSNEKKGSSDAVLTDEVEWVPPSKQEIEMNARKARVGSRAVSAMAPPVYFDDERRETLTDEELLIANPQLDEEENKRICYYFKTKTQCYTTVFLTTFATPVTQDSLVENWILENNDWSSVGVMLDTGSGLLPGGTIRNTCFNSGTYSGTGNAAAVAAFPYEPGITQLQTISNSNFYGPGNTFFFTDVGLIFLKLVALVGLPVSFQNADQYFS
jgi:hypothetical protein